jgi:hypothetical protein
VLVRRIAAPFDRVTLFVERGFLVDVWILVQVLDILGDSHALGVLPRSLADAVARIDGLSTVDRALAEISAPGFGACARLARELRAIGVRTRESAKIGAFALN